MATFAELYFGLADGNDEANQNEESFLASFVDHQGVVPAIRQRKKFLLLGPKGSGKTTFARYLQETALGEREILGLRDISELPLSEVEKIKTGESAGPGRTMTAWRLLILCGLLDLMLKDQASSLQHDPQAIRVTNELRKLGFMDPTPKNAVIAASKSTFKLNFATFGEYSREQESSSSINLYNLVPHLERWVVENESPNSYLLMLDGLDSIYLNDERYSIVIASLLQAAYSVHQKLRMNSSLAHIVLLVRNDLFSRISLADAGKMRRDHGIELDWRILSGNPQEAPLFKVANKKAGSILGEQIDVVRDYFPEDIQLGGKSGAPRWAPTYQYLLDLTRHTPRDLLQLFEACRSYAASVGSSMQDGHLRPGVIREGVLQYATKYFVDAIKNELVGVNGPDPTLARRAMDTLRQLGKQRFTRDEFANECFGAPTNEDRRLADDFLRWLFYAGAIGNLRQANYGMYLQFYHRREDSEIYLKGPLVLHSALVYAWGSSFGSPGRSRSR